MDIKLRARLSAYARVETLQPSGTTSPDCGCELINVGPVREGRIDELFMSEPPVQEETPNRIHGAAFIDSLFK